MTGVGLNLPLPYGLLLNIVCQTTVKGTGSISHTFLP